MKIKQKISRIENLAENIYVSAMLCAFVYISSSSTLSAKEVNAEKKITADAESDEFLVSRLIKKTQR